MKEIRDIKLDLLMGNKNPIIDLFCKITSGIEIINCNVYNEEGLEFIYHKDGQWIFYQDCKNEKFWTHYYRYWEILEREFSLQYDDIQEITKFLVEETLKREVTKPLVFRMKLSSKVEETLKREVDTPRMCTKTFYSQVEETLKRELTTPLVPYIDKPDPVEETLKREEITPDSTVTRNFFLVKEALKKELNK
jgi:hypothetical protein